MEYDKNNQNIREKDDIIMTKRLNNIKFNIGKSTQNFLNSKISTTTLKKNAESAYELLDNNYLKKSKAKPSNVINVNNNAEESQKTLEVAREILKGENAEFVSVSGDVPGDEIIKYRRANNLDLIATGAFSKGFFKKLILGSVSQDILQNALVPILVLA